MSLDDSEIAKLEFLSRIKLSESEKSAFTTKFIQVLHLLEKIDDFHRDECKILTKVLDKKQEFREDIAYNRNSIEDVFLNSSNKNDNYSDKRYFLVPKTIK